MNNILKSIFPPIKRDTLAHYSFIFILLLGLFLRFYQYLMGRSLWEDEAHLALNFIYSGYADLVKPLSHQQSAPILFLFTVETITDLFGFGERALRFFPFIVSILTFPLFYYLVLELTKNKRTSLIAFFLYAVNASFIYFASELKPYTIDVSVIVLMGYLTFTSCPSVKKNHLVILTAAGVLSIFYSNISPIVLSCIGLYKISLWLKNHKIQKENLVMFLYWIVAFAVNYSLFIYEHPYAEELKEEWAFTFLGNKSLASFLIQSIDTIFFQLLSIEKNFPSLIFVLALFIFTTVYLLIKRNFTLLIFIFLPIVIHLSLSALKLYPFYYRFILYLIPGVIILISIGISSLGNLITTKVNLEISAALVSIMCYTLIISNIKQFPIWHREVKPSLNYMKENYPNTRIYITTPFTLYKYYLLTNYVNDTSFVALEWRIKPERYYELTRTQQSNYLLFHTTNSYGDGYQTVIEDLKRKHLIVKEFEYKMYTVSEVKPLPAP